MSGSWTVLAAPAAPLAGAIGVALFHGRPNLREGATIAASLALIPFLFLGQHFNRHHRKAFDWTLLQVPLLLSVLLWPVLWVWSVIDAYQVAMFNVAEAENKRRAHLAAL